MLDQRDTGRPDNNLPFQLTSLVGREREISEVEGRLREARLLTLTGPGGSGKTRLALASAADLVEDYEGGVWLVELAPLSDPELVAQAVASVLGVREEPGQPLAEALSGHLEAKEILLVLDNCEHLIEASASLAAALLARCPDLRVLATSRETLRVPGEVVFAVPPLSLPDPRRSPDIEGLSEYEAAHLFAERARAAGSGFSPTEANALAVAQICHRLDGIPLAIELAAARTRALSVEQISVRLKESFSLLSGGGRTAMARHGTLRATMDWSHDLLTEEEKAVFGRLSVFAGGFALEAAEAVCADEGIGEAGVLEPLGSLVGKSLVVFEQRGGAARYRLLETVRQYASEKLEGSGEAGKVRSRHARYYLGLAEEAEPELKGARQVAWMERLEKEHYNLRAAMRFLLEEDEVEAAARLAWALWLFWWYHGHHAEGRRFAEEILARGGDLPPDLLGKTFWTRAMMSYGLESIERMERLFEESAAHFRLAGDRFGRGIATSGVGVAALQQGDMERALALFEEALKLLREVGNKWGISNVLANLGMACFGGGDPEGAGRHFEEALAISREIGDRLSGYVSLYNLALSSRARGDNERAARLYAEGLNLAEEIGDEANAAYCLEGLAVLIAESGEPERAVKLLGASEALLEAVGAPLYAQVPDRASIERTVEALRYRMGDTVFEASWGEGRAMSLERAVECALEAPPTPKEPASPSSPYPAGLSAREVEVLKLLAQGMTNARIAEELFLSPRTVNAHLRAVYHKIGTSTRAEAARFASEYNLL
jgi:predicted ATPase/DNA-binding CsgD family transcriptional regulator/Tfp pilus assembly protein PilF